MKVFSRIVVVNLIIAYVLSFYFPFYYSKPIEGIQIGELLLLIWVVLSIMTGLFLWGYFFYHWGISKFKSRYVKILWFWVLFLGTVLYLIGPFIYYVIVYEMGKGLRVEDKNISNLSIDN